MAELPPPRKFMFERSFDNGAAVRAPERKPVTLKPEQVDALKKEAYDAGFAAGHQTGADQQTAQLMATLARVDEHIGQMIGNMQAFHQRQDAQMRQLVIAVARKILPDFTARNGLQEIEAVLSGVIAEMVYEPRLVIRVHESQFDPIKTKVHEIAAQRAYAGSVVILSDPEIACGDCRVEWADGGIERNTAGTLKDVEGMISPSGAAIPNSNQE